MPLEPDNLCHLEFVFGGSDGSHGVDVVVDVADVTSNGRLGDAHERIQLLLLA
jgi:hypothetical protein